MDITQSLNAAITYIEEHLEEEIDVSKVAKIAGCSAYNFTRMFSYIAGISFVDYIRKRRLTKATYELQHTDIKIIDLCYKYGYDSPTAFNRAFQKQHGISPSMARQKGVMLKAYLPLTFQITIKGVVSMDFRIEAREGFRAIGMKRTFSTVDEQNFKNIPKMWQEIMQDDTFAKLMSLNDTAPKGALGICANMRGSEFDYYIAVPSTKGLSEGLEEITISPTTYAIFPAQMNEIQDITKRIFSEWLPNSQYQHQDAPEIEFYPDGTRCEIMIPITEK